MDGAFAYGRELYAAADAGQLSAGEADALARARMDEILQRRRSQADFHRWLESRFPPKPSD
jgi:hypothetical protein